MTPHLFTVVAAAAALASFAPSLHGQANGSVAGTITDSATGKPIAGARVAATCASCYGRYPTDTAGHYRLTALPAGMVDIAAHCPSATGLGAAITATSISITSGREATLDIRVPPGGCFDPAYSERRGIFRGYWTPGFESSAFLPCADSTLGVSAPLLPGKRVVAPKAWAELAPNAWRPGTVPPRHAPIDSWGNPTYFVVWRGVLRGPGQYGHMGVSALSMLVDSLIAIDDRGPADCRTR